MSANDAARGLHHLLYAWKEISVVVTGLEGRIHALLDLLVDGIDLRQPEGCDKGSRQALAGEVDAFGKGSAQHGKSYPVSRRGEACQKVRLFSLFHSTRLLPDRNFRVSCPEQQRDHLQVVEAAEECQIISRHSFILAGYQISDRRNRTLAMLITGRNVADDSY